MVGTGRAAARTGAAAAAAAAVVFAGTTSDGGVTAGTGARATIPGVGARAGRVATGGLLLVASVVRVAVSPGFGAGARPGAEMGNCKKKVI